jgi:hypothetical protein
MLYASTLPRLHVVCQHLAYVPAQTTGSPKHIAHDVRSGRVGTVASNDTHASHAARPVVDADDDFVKAYLEVPLRQVDQRQVDRPVQRCVCAFVRACV